MRVSGDVRGLENQSSEILIHHGLEQELDPVGLALLICEIASLRGPF